MTIFSTAEKQQREPMEIGGKVLFYPDDALRPRAVTSVWLRRGGATCCKIAS